LRFQTKYDGCMGSDVDDGNPGTPSKLRVKPRGEAGIQNEKNTGKAWRIYITFEGESYSSTKRGIQKLRAGGGIWVDSIGGWVESKARRAFDGAASLRR
jgi:hypothetical protein